MNQTFSSVRHGYSPEEVDSYINELQLLIAQRNQELQEYRARENEIETIKHTTEQQADAIIRQAHKDADAIVQQARDESRTIRQEAVRDMDDIVQKAKVLAVKMDSFRDAYDQLINQYLLSARTNDIAAMFADLNTFLNKLGIPREEEAVSVNDIAVGNR